jgi:tetratricopeptide (TPR) repeat protein
LAKVAIALDAKNYRAHLLMADYEATIHSFERSRTSLNRAQGLGAPQIDIDLAKASLSLSQGVVDQVELLSAKPQNAALRAKLAVLEAEAQLLSGNSKKADELYGSLLASYRDVSPFFPAWILFKRGLMWGEWAGDVDRAKAYYIEAIRIFPHFVRATVHLAEIEANQGLRQRAINRLLALNISKDSDPEPMGLMADLYQKEQQLESAHVWKNMAETRYEQLIKNFPLAFLDHAAEFYLGAGENTARAAEYAKKNLTLRKTERSYLLALKALLKEPHKNNPCILSEEIDHLKIVSQPLKELMKISKQWCSGN